MEPCIYIIADGFGVTIDKDNVEFFDLLQGPFVILDLRERITTWAYMLAVRFETKKGVVNGPIVCWACARFQ